MPESALRKWAVIAAAVGAVRVASATTYYVSPTGSDSNSGTSASSPWSSVTKVDDTSFSPGDQVLFQYGGTFNGSLDASSSGTVSAPITYSAYGNAALGNPVFSGSDHVDSSAFAPVAGTTFAMTAATPVNWVYNNNSFTREAQDATGSTAPATDLSFVESTPNSFYYNSGNGQLFVNLGTSNLASQSIALGTRADAIFNNYHSNLVFNHLSTANTAQDDAGYGIRVQNGTNVTVQNATVTNAGKHGVGVIDGNNFTGSNLNVVSLQPDLVYGGASAYVAFSDVSTASIHSGGDSSVWNNLGFTNTNGAYAAFVSHGDPGAIGSLKINNLVSNNGYGSGTDIQSTGPNEKVVLTNSTFTGAIVAVETNNAILSGLKLLGNATVALSGNNSVVQNSLFLGQNPDEQAGDNGSIVDSGTGNTYRLNTFQGTATLGPAIGIMTAGSNTKIYGNVFDAPLEISQEANGSPLLSMDDNLYAYLGGSNNGPTFGIGPYSTETYYAPLSTWQALGYDLNSIVGDANFNADYTLGAGSPGLDLYTDPLDPTLADANALLTPEYANGTFDAGIETAAVPEPVGLGLVAASAVGLAARRRRSV
jgi:hypothetical protein